MWDILAIDFMPRDINRCFVKTKTLFVALEPACTISATLKLSDESLEALDISFVMRIRDLRWDIMG